MKLVADMHVHLYACYDLSRAFAALSRNLQDLAPDAAYRLAFLTERVECRVFDDLATGRVSPPLGFDVGKTADPAALWVLRDGKRDFLLLAGRQIATRERLEILCLAATGEFADQQTVNEAVRSVQVAGGLPVVAWSPGKWFFRRGNLVKGLIDLHEPGSMALGDTTLRPTIWGTPGLMTYGRELGHRVLAGTDSLPVAGEEKLLGTYGTMLDMPFDSERPAQSFIKAFKAGDVTTRLLGQRSYALDVFKRLRAYRKSRTG